MIGDGGDNVYVCLTIFVCGGEVEVVLDSLLEAFVHLLAALGCRQDEGKIVVLIVIERLGEVDADWVDVAVDVLDGLFERCASQATVGVAAKVAALFPLRR